MRKVVNTWKLGLHLHLQQPMYTVLWHLVNIFSFTLYILLLRVLRPHTHTIREKIQMMAATLMRWQRLRMLVLFVALAVLILKGVSSGVSTDTPKDEYEGHEHGHHGHVHSDGRPCSVQLKDGPETMMQEEKRRERIRRSRLRGAQISRLQNAGLPIDATLLEEQLPWVAVDAFRLPNVPVNFHLFFPPTEKQPLTDVSIQVRIHAS